MWGDIVLSIGLSIGEALCINQIETRKRKRNNNKINSILQKALVEFADTTIDCSEFHLYVQSTAFKQHLQGYFYTSDYQVAHVQSYKQSIAQCILEVVSGVRVDELYAFLDKLILLYNEHLKKMIEKDPTISALFQLLIKANQDSLNRIINEQSKVLAYLKSQQASDLFIDNEDIRTYHSVCEKEYSEIRFTGIAGAESRQQQSINSFFIESGFSYGLNNFRDQYIELLRLLPDISINSIFDISNKIVLLGGAGLGKTTTLNYIYCNYERLFGSCALKFKIDLKHYAKDIVEGNKDILSCISADFYRKTRRKNTSLETVSSLIADILAKGKCLVILDALDEINLQSARSFVRDRIGEFTELYPLNRIIISSRETGYLRNRFDSSFLHLRINEFGGAQINQYARNWYKLNGTNDVKGSLKRFQKEVARARCEKLISNPIILILALIIFDIEKNLPNKRVEFYQKCIDTFLSIREDRRGTQNLCEKAKNILADDCVVPQIAHHKFIRDQEQMDYRFTSRELTDAIFNAINVPDPINWQTAVQMYTVYLIERTELIQEVDEDTLDFAHKTFFEYFLAVYYVKEYDEQQLSDQLVKWIGDSNLDELARLIIEVVIRNNNSRQHHRIMEFLFSSIKKPGEGDKMLSVSALSILSDLYGHNMLLPRYHRQYFECLLENAQYVYEAKVLRYGKTSDYDSIRYDSKLLADLFVEKESQGMISTDRIDDLYYLNKEFQNYVMELRDDSAYKQIIELFRCNYQSEDQDVTGILEYFLYGEGVSLILQYPQVYLSLLNFLESSETEFDRRLLSKCSFSYNSRFMHFISPETLNHMMYRAMQSSVDFVILLNVIILCASKKTNFIFRFILNHYNHGLDLGRESNGEFVIWLFNALNDSEDSSCFLDALKKRGLYDSEYDTILKVYFDRYVEYEKSCENERLEQIVKKARGRHAVEIAG